MLDRLKQIPKKLQEIWKKYSAKQRAIIVSTVAVVVLALIILIVIPNQTNFEKLTTFENTATAKAAMALLDENAIENRLNADNVTVEVNEKQKQDAVLALADSELMAESSFSLADLLASDGVGTTSSDKTRNLHLYLQSELNARISKMDGVDKASVIYYPADTSRSILKDQSEIGVSIMLTINDKFDKKNTPLGIATSVAYAVGNSSTDKIKVIDQHGRLLFGGDSTDPDANTAEAALTYEQTVEKWYTDKMLELATINGYYNAEIVPHLDVNMEKTSEMFTEYIAGEGLEQGLYSEVIKISSENSGVSGDMPGTDSNDETDYYIQTSGSGESAYNEEHYIYKPSERVTQTVRNSPFIVHETSSMAITLRKAIQISEESLEEAGELDEITFQRYMEEHQDITEITDQDEIDALKQLFSDASGIPVQNITLRAYTEPLYIPKAEEESMNFSLILEILLAALIVGLLLFVVFRAMKPAEVIETEPELSVERLLATTRENQSLEDIEFGEKSETRRMIEKYIDENAESVAALLRNWLNDDGWD